jgi:hypothetical protein
MQLSKKAWHCDLRMMALTTSSGWNFHKSLIDKSIAPNVSYHYKMLPRAMLIPLQNTTALCPLLIVGGKAVQVSKIKVIQKLDI